MPRRNNTGKTEEKNPNFYIVLIPEPQKRGNPQAQVRSLYRCFAFCLTLKYFKPHRPILQGTFKLCSPSRGTPKPAKIPSTSLFPFSLLHEAEPAQRSMFIPVRRVGRSPARTTMTIVSYNYYHVSHPFLWVMRSGSLSSTTATAGFLPRQRSADIWCHSGFVTPVPAPFPLTKETGFHFLPETTRSTISFEEKSSLGAC